MHRFYAAAIALLTLTGCADRRAETLERDLAAVRGELARLTERVADLEAQDTNPTGSETAYPSALQVPPELDDRETVVSFAHSVYKAAFAHISDNLDHRVVRGDCRIGYVAGVYGVMEIRVGLVRSCEVTDGGNNRPRVVLVAEDGFRMELP